MTQENCMRLHKHYVDTGQTNKADIQAYRLKHQYGVEISKEEKKGKK